MFRDYGGVYCCDVGVYVLFCNAVWICADLRCVSSVSECGLFLESRSGVVYC